MPGERPAGPARLLWLDALRGLAVVGVVAIHVLAAPLLRPSQQTFGGLLWLTILDAASRFSVPAVMVASGLLLTLSQQRRPLPYREFLRRRAWRVVPAYLAWSAVYTVAQGQADGPTAFARSWLRHCLVGDASFHTWFVPVILHLYLLHPLLLHALRRVLTRRRSAAWGIAALVTLKLAMTVWWFPYGFLDGLPPLLAAYLRGGPLAALTWSPYFVIGLLAAAWWTAEDRAAPSLGWVPRLGGISLVLAVLLRANDLSAMPDLDHGAHWAALGWDTASTVLAALGGLAFFGRLLQRPELARAATLLARLGPASYGLYLGHVLVLQQLSRIKLFLVLSLIAETAAAAIVVTLVLTIALLAILARLPGLHPVIGIEPPSSSTDNIVRH